MKDEKQGKTLECFNCYWSSFSLTFGGIECANPKSGKVELTGEPGETCLFYAEEVKNERY